MIRKKLILLCLFVVVNINASTLISQNTYKFRDRVEIALNFDDKFDGEIFLTKEENSYNIILKSVSSKEKFQANVNSSLISKFTIENVDEGVEIKATGRSNLELDALLSKNSKTLNIKFVDKNAIKETTTLQDTTTTKKKTNDTQSKFKLSYIIPPIALIGIFIFLYFKFKKRVVKDDLFNESAQEDILAKDDTTQEKDFTNEPKIIYNNKITDDRELLLIEKEGKRYITFLTRDNELPKESYMEMLENEDKFQEFLEICKNKSI